MAQINRACDETQARFKFSPPEMCGYPSSISPPLPVTDPFQISAFCPDPYFFPLCFCLLLQWSVGCVCGQFKFIRALSAKQVQLSLERLSKLLAPLTWMSEFLLKQILRIQIYGLRHPKSMMISLKIPNWGALDLIFEQSGLHELGLHRHQGTINVPAIPS